MTSRTNPCRLFVFLARRAAVGVVLRRGPSDWFQMSSWHTDTDTFEHGQWLKGRVYERRSDVSSDGALFAFFARRLGGSISADSKAADSCVAISRPPWFTALALWFVGGTYWLGAYFPETPDLWGTGKERVFVGGPLRQADQGSLPSWLEVTAEFPHRVPPPDSTDKTVFHNRLLRDGWRPVESRGGFSWERRPPRGADTLLLAEKGWDATVYGGPHLVEYAVCTAAGELQPLEGATWADWDQRGRLAFTRSGVLYVYETDGTPRGLLDFNDQEPDAQRSPDAMREWPQRPPGETGVGTGGPSQASARASG